jgi:hypothetical protein
MRRVPLPLLRLLLCDICELLRQLAGGTSQGVEQAQLAAGAQEGGMHRLQEAGRICWQ